MKRFATYTNNPTVLPHKVHTVFDMSFKVRYVSNAHTTNQPQSEVMMVSRVLLRTDERWAEVRPLNVSDPTAQQQVLGGKTSA